MAHRKTPLVHRTLLSGLGVLVVTFGTTSLASATTRSAAIPALFPRSGLFASIAPRRPVGAVAIGAVSTHQRLTVDVTLKVPDMAALDDFISAVSDRSSPLFHHFLRAGQFASEFGPSSATVSQVESVLRRGDLS